MSDSASAKRRRINPFSDSSSNGSQSHDSTFVPESSEDDARFKPGNIIKLKVWNFTTYSYGEFYLSPSLNMIIGPNGTGKSTFVAAVCLGLGGKVDLIKRKSMDSMIKSGERESRIEITMKNHDGQPNLVIERTFAMKVAKSNWKVNGAPSDIKSVQELVGQYNIQLDNLCHFLPQERVAEFASLSPEKLLLETERTIGDNTLLDKHKKLIELDDLWVNLTKDVEILEERLTSMRAEVEKCEVEAQKYQQFEEKAVQIDYHKKLLPYAKLQDLKERMEQLRSERDKAKKALQEFKGNTRPLDKMRTEVDNQIINTSKAHNEIKEKITSLRQEYERQIRKAESMASEFSAAQNEIDSLKSSSERQKQELEQRKGEKEEIEQRMSTMESIDMSLLPTLTAKRQEKYEEKAQAEEDFDTVRTSHSNLKRDINNSEVSVREEQKKLETNDRLEVLRSNSTRFRRDLMQSAYEAHSLLRKEKQSRPELEYFEAPVVCCRVTDRRYAKYFEKLVDNNTLFSFFFAGEAQYQAVSRMLPPNLNVPMRVAAGSAMPPPMSSSRLKEFGFDGYLSDFVTGPETVMKGLNIRSYLHCIPVSLSPLRPDVINKLLRPENGKPPFRRFIVGDDLFVINQSKYGSRQVFYQTEGISPAQIMGAEGLSEDLKKEITQRVERSKERIKQMNEQLVPLEAEKARFMNKMQKMDDEMKDVDAAVRGLRKKQETRSKLDASLSTVENRITELTRRINQDHSEQIKVKESDLLKLYVSHADVNIKATQISEKLVVEAISLKKSDLSRLQFENRKLWLDSLSIELEERKSKLEHIYRTAKEKCEQFKPADLVDEIKNQRLGPEEKAAVAELVSAYRDEMKLTESYVVRKIEQLEEDLSVLANVDRGSIETLKRKRKELDAAELELPAKIDRRDSSKAQMDEISIPWEEELSGMVEQISTAFQKRFITVASDGQVELVKSDRFKDWKLEILVKFRESAELKVLDHQSQSGGERAVSTIFFIMSLQGLTKAPIRIVDEINQGMDPKNEKMAHKYLVDTACRNGQSQYFLVTPKLLTGLYYHPDMVIHCIFTGPHLAKGEPNGSKGSKGGYLNFQNKKAINA